MSSSVVQRVLVVANKRLPGITIYNADTLQVLGKATTGVAPHEVAISANGHFAYAPIYGSSGVGKPGTDEHCFHIFRTYDCGEVAAIDTGDFKRPHSLAVGRSGLVYVTAEIAAAVIVIDPAAKQIIGHIPTGSYTTHMLAVNSDETTIYCSNVQSKTISVLDVPSRKLACTIPTEGENQRMTISPENRWFVTNLGPAGKVAFYQTIDNTLDFEVPVVGVPFVSKFSNDGKFLFCAGMGTGVNKGSALAWKIDPATRTVLATAENLGNELGALEVNPFDGAVYVSDQPTNRITVLDPESFAPVKTIATESAPDGMAFAAVIKRT